MKSLASIQGIIYITLEQKIIAVIKNNDSDSLNVFNIFHLLNKDERISFDLFSPGLDWLFLLAGVEIANDQLKKCF